MVVVVVLIEQLLTGGTARTWRGNASRWKSRSASLRCSKLLRRSAIKSSWPCRNGLHRLRPAPQLWHLLLQQHRLHQPSLQRQARRSCVTVSIARRADYIANTYQHQTTWPRPSLYAS